ncbi:MAG TPA: excinuclease ABC subunit UvrC [Candidatus Omnitrophota bacterium]|nr:excinuclease ABC subunit UvrC [Candidatus Omnitrophota bacterium]HPD84421.1 excinuclease ABC subunit UvrC [Candidatus Omnitrophota bacterium]HRZ03279.1 excinuclease ABC subunit UvrC [Candidatus Omnitrophota bacterium]
MELKERIKQLPLTSGVYLMKDAAGAVLYVGKAVCLRKRVQSYFRKSTTLSKTDFLVSEIRSIDYISTASEAEALILEASLIKQYQPKYNVELRDGKSYPFIQITDEEFPRVVVVRPNAGRPGPREVKGKYFGPYVNAKLIREALTIIRKIFHFRACHPFPNKACLDYHMGLCDAPCERRIGKKEYAKIIRNVCLILEGKKDVLYKNLREEMEGLSREKGFEEAAKVRDQLRAIGALYSGTKDINYYKEAEQLQRVLNLPKLPERIEAFDISNIMGHQAVGSMVSFFNGKPDKNNYRRFRIREVQAIDDFKMIAEVVRRRYHRLKEEGRMFPDLIVIDGGKGQLSSAGQELEKLQIQIPLISIAKRQEEIFIPGKRNPVILSRDSLGLRLVQRVRDEAHRFAVSYHRQLRGKEVFIDFPRTKET